MLREAMLLAVSLALVACGGGDESGASSTTGGTGGSTAGAGGAAGGGAGGTGGSGATVSAPACADVVSLAETYKAAHPGNGGKDWDILAKTPAEIASDPDAQKLLALCGADERPVIPLLAWEYGGADHPWINPQASATAYCVYIPVAPSSTHWQYDATADHVTADVYVPCPDDNPCKGQQGADQVLSCLGDPSNIEIMVDTASLNDGAGAGLSLSEASTDLYLILPDDSRVHLYTGN